MTDEMKKPEEPLAKYRKVDSGTPYRGVAADDPLGFTRDEANRSRHGPRERIAHDTDFNPFDP